MLDGTRNLTAAVVGLVALARATALATEPPQAQGTSIIVAGQPFDVGRPVVLWNDPQGFDAYQIRCIDQHGGCCDSDSKRYGVAQRVNPSTLEDMQQPGSRSWCCTSTAA